MVAQCANKKDVMPLLFCYIYPKSTAKQGVAAARRTTIYMYRSKNRGMAYNTNRNLPIQGPDTVSSSDLASASF
jgi:hypothetical protein